MGCENLGSFVKSLSLLVSKKTRPSIRPPDGNLFTAFWLVLHRERLSRSYSFLFLHEINMPSVKKSTQQKIERLSRARPSGAGRIL